MIEKWDLDEVLGARAASASTNTFKKYLRKAPRNTAKVLPTIAVPAFMPTQVQIDLTDHRRALYDLSGMLASEIKDPSVRIPLIRTPLEPTPEAQAQLAIDRFDAFLTDRAKLRGSRGKIGPKKDPDVAFPGPGGARNRAWYLTTL